ARRPGADRGVFPAGAHLVHDRLAETEGRKRIQARRMRVNQVGLRCRDHDSQPAPQLTNDIELIQDGQGCKPPAAGIHALKLETFDCLGLRRARAVLWTGDLLRLQAERALLAQDRLAAKRVAALHGQRMIQNVKDAHDQCGLRAGVCGRASVPRSRRRMTCSKSCNRPATVGAQPNCSAWRRTASRSTCVERMRVHAAAMAAAERSVISSPATGALTTSPLPPTAVAMTGVPQARLSSSTLGMPSLFEASTVASAAR